MEVTFNKRFAVSSRIESSGEPSLAGVSRTTERWVDVSDIPQKVLDEVEKDIIQSFERLTDRSIPT